MSILTHLSLPPYTLMGASLGGLYTSLYIPELESVFDVGFPMRSASMAKRLFLSHAHLDHIGALPALLGMRGMMGKGNQALDVYCPYGVYEDLQNLIDVFSKMHSFELPIQWYPLHPGEDRWIKKGIYVRALKTFHPVPSLGYLWYEKVQKLKTQYLGLSGKEIKALKDQNTDLFDWQIRPKVAYLTDTLSEALKHSPLALEADLLILECTFLSTKKGIEIARKGCHIHLDELIEWAPYFKNKHIVLMHFSQIHTISEIKELCSTRLGPILGDRLHLLLPQSVPTSHLQWWV